MISIEISLQNTLSLPINETLHVFDFSNADFTGMSLFLLDCDSNDIEYVWASFQEKIKFLKQKFVLESIRDLNGFQLI